MPAVLLSWFPGQEAGHALADVLLGAAEPGGRLPTTWPSHAEDCPVLDPRPTDGVLRYDEGVLVGYPGWKHSAVAPAYWFGHGLGYTDWDYESAEFLPVDGEPTADDRASLGVLRVRVRNIGTRPGREIVQTYLEPAVTGTPSDIGHSPCRLAGFASAQADPGQTVTVDIEVPRRAAQFWDTTTQSWRDLPGGHRLRTGRSYADLRLDTTVARG
ncbi:hypothetical protein BEK98_45315 [Streptomyces diastatochromogenes]|uniref:Fibronectin type III-like domain-containing protein n=1 Tax=Streptomyces diastatochromogenes TaxID=42236 RepID=A0A233RR06_STRDA|nr:hypothetical protein BEK98_45315 [Streptomyces diastatochromogenes]